ncbi:type IV pilus assembly protein PilM [Candidatus Saccharibacteria bacterium]|nr:type IV pilus assembly protein PilM [Candidatus Saccharibacteria bacterium]
MRSLNFYHDQPLFGLDFGHSTIKVMQLASEAGKAPKVLGYGIIDYPPDAVKDGSVINPSAVAKSLHNLFTSHLVGSISTRRVACTIPTSRTYSRPMRLPPMSDEDITEAVHLEAEQYIPISSASLYIDYDVSRKDSEGTELLVVATPKSIIDSHVSLLESAGLEVVAFEPTMNASARVFAVADTSHDEPSILIDFGSVSVDLALFDKTMFVNSTIVGGGNDITLMISQRLGVNQEEAYALKNNYGIGVSEKRGEIQTAIEPILNNLVKEIQKIIRYYDERKVQNQKKIGQIVTMGGGANMPGLSAYLSTQLQMPAKMLEPWHKIDFGNLALPDDIERSMYITVAGEALLNPKEIFT